MHILHLFLYYHRILIYINDQKIVGTHSSIIYLFIYINQFLI